jgi:hypothetical protein
MFKNQEIIHHSNLTIKSEKRIIRIRQCEVTTGRDARFDPTIGLVTPNGFTTIHLLTGEIDRLSTGRVDPVWGCLNNPSRLG